MTRTRSVLSLFLLTVLMGGWPGCTMPIKGDEATFKALTVSAATLDGVERSFEAVNGIYVQGCDVAKTIQKDQCNKFVDFGEKFKKAFRPAVNGWKVARKANDASAAALNYTTIMALSTELAGLAADVIDLAKGKAATP